MIGQIEIGTFPINIDEDLKLNYTVDYIDNDLVEQTGAHLIWDLSNSQSPLFEDLVINKKGFGINGIKVTHSVDNGSIVKYYKKNRKEFNELGFHKDSKFPYSILYDKPLSFSTDYLIYGATFSDSTSFSLIRQREELPFELIRNLPKKVKAIKIVGNIKRYYHCDAHGKFILSEKSVPALRMKIIEKTNIRLYDIQSGNEIPYVNDKILKSIYPNTGNNVSYVFFSNSSKYYFAKINYSTSTNSYIIKYQNDNSEDNILKINNKKKTFVIFPNPTYDIAKFLISNYSNGKYKLEIYNIIGKRIWDTDVIISSNSLLKYNFSFLRKGTYLVALKDKYGNILTTKKLVIIAV